MLEEKKWCRKAIKKHFNKPLKMTDEEEENFKKADECHICNKQYVEKHIKVIDHCHVTGKYCGSAHQSCNINFQLSDKFPVILHNLRGYDSHFVI